ncbi:MAG: TetR/AcrR family transcriptional regulator [Candidatus Binatales bacterium]
MLSQAVKRNATSSRSGTGQLDLRAKILKAARRLFLKRGADGVTARKIAAAVGCSATAIYLYYRNLDEVLHELRMEGHTLLARYLTSRAPAAPIVSRLESMGRGYFRFGLENPEFYDLMFLARASRTARREEIRREMFPLLLLRDAIKEGIDAGELRPELDPMLTANVLWAQIHGLTSLAVQGLLFETAPATHAQVLEQVLSTARGLAKRSGRGS